MKKLNYLAIMPRFLENTANETIFPLGIAYVTSSMKHAGFNVFNLNLNHSTDSDEIVISSFIEKYDIDVVVMGGLSFQYSILQELIDIIKKIKPEIIVIAGGGIITGDPETAMKALAGVDYGIMGEGEVTVCELCDTLENGGRLETVKGILFWGKDGILIKNKEREDIEDLDLLPFPDYEGFQFEKHLPKEDLDDQENSSDTRKQLNAVYIIGSRSCPYNCTFCFHTSGKKYRQRSLDNIFEEIDYLVNRYHIKFIGLQDELFSHDKKRIVEFCKRIKHYKLGWWAQFRVDMVDQEIIDLIIESGCKVMGFGLESADDRILKSMRKGIKVSQIEETLEMVYKSGIPFVGTFIFGDREETVETAHTTLEWWKAHPHLRIDLRLIMVYPGSAMYKYAIETGVIKDPIKYLKDGCPQINLSKMSDKEFALISEEILNAPMDNAVAFESYKYSNKKLTAICANCGHENVYNDVVFFTGSYLVCERCGQKHNVTLIDEVLNSVESNIKNLLEQYGKVAIWAVNYYVNDIVNKLEVFKSENLYLIDLSETKQNMILNGKSINKPELIDKVGIKAVIVGVPTYKIQIEKQIHENYKQVDAVIDICDLI